MAHSKLSELLQKIPEIAKAVNEFQSPELQKRAFEALMTAAGADLGITDRQAAKETQRETRATRKRSDEARKSGSRRSGDSFKIVDVDLHPPKELPLKAFFAEKSPKTDPEKYACVVYYMRKYAGISDVTHDHIYTAFKHLGLKVPNIQIGLNNTRVRHGWLSFSGSSPINLTRIGENFVEHELPRGLDGNGDDSK